MLLSRLSACGWQSFRTQVTSGSGAPPNQYTRLLRDGGIQVQNVIKKSSSALARLSTPASPENASPPTRMRPFASAPPAVTDEPVFQTLAGLGLGPMNEGVPGEQTKGAGDVDVAGTGRLVFLGGERGGDGKPGGRSWIA
jgi:hypothetical protein